MVASEEMSGPVILDLSAPESSPARPRRPQACVIEFGAPPGTENTFKKRLAEKSGCE
jgi:hypothetical protein